MNNKNSKFVVVILFLIVFGIILYLFTGSQLLKGTESVLSCPENAPEKIGKYCCPDGYQSISEDGLCYNEEYNVETDKCEKRKYLPSGSCDVFFDENDNIDYGADGYKDYSCEGYTFENNSDFNHVLLSADKSYCTATPVVGPFLRITLHSSGGLLGVGGIDFDHPNRLELRSCDYSGNSCSFTCAFNEGENFCRDIEFSLFNVIMGSGCNAAGCTSKNKYFNHWGTSEDCTDGIKGIEILENDIDLYACFVTKEYISYNPNGGIMIDNRDDNICNGSTYCTHTDFCLKSVHSETCDMSLDLSATKSGSIFKGWAKDTTCNEIYNDSVPISENTIMYACWE